MQTPCREPQHLSQCTGQPHELRVSYDDGYPSLLCIPAPQSSLQIVLLSRSMHAVLHVIKGSYCLSQGMRRMRTQARCP